MTSFDRIPVTVEQAQEFVNLLSATHLSAYNSYHEIGQTMELDIMLNGRQNIKWDEYNELKDGYLKVMVELENLGRDICNRFNFPISF